MDTKLIILLATTAALVSTSSANDVGSKPPVEAKAKFVPVVTSKMQGDVRLQWITEMRTKLPMSQRHVGPFGLAQDPNQKVAVKKAKSVSSTAFLNAVKAMNINFVNAVDGRFAVGSREFRRGQIFPLVRGGQKFLTQVVKVRKSYIICKDVNNVEHIKKNLEMLKEGMTKNVKLEEIEGIESTRSGKDQPLNLP